MADGFPARRPLAALLAVGQVVLALSGCVSVKTTATRPSEGPGGGVAVKVFPDDSTRRGNQVGPMGIVGELERQDGKAWRPVFRSLNPSWVVVGLPPGSYRVSFPARLTDAGDVERLEKPVQETFKVKQGKMTDVQVTLSHISPALVVIAVVTVVVAAVLIADYLSDHDLPEPPLPPPELVDVAFHISLDLATAAAWGTVWDRSVPTVTSHFPAAGALVAARRPRVTFCLSKPAQPSKVEAQGVSVLGESSGLIEGVVSYDTSNWWVVWTPSQDLPPGDTYHVTMAGDAVEDQAGNEPGRAFSFSFKTAR